MELVYVLPARALPDPSGRVLPLDGALWSRLTREGFYRFRHQMEEDPTYRQVIPYAVVTYRGRVFLTRRIRGGGEKRLAGLFSIGLGGHINLWDQCRDPVTWALYRELWEEAGIKARSLRRMGLILTSTTPVERVHVGVLFLVEADRKPEVREREKLEGRLVSGRELDDLLPRMEGWSQLAWRHLGPRIGGDLDERLGLV